MRCGFVGLLFFLVFLLMGAFCSAPKPINPRALEQQKACVENLQVGDYARAKLRCELCTQYDDSVPECWNGLGLVALGQGKKQVAIDNFTRAIRESTNFAQARNNLGVVYFKEGNFEKAHTLFKASLEIDPGYNDARYNYGLVLLRMGRQAMSGGDDEQTKKYFKSATEQYQMLIELNPKYANAHRDLGLISTYKASMEKIDDRIMQNLVQAEKYFSQCLSLDPSNEACRESLGHTHLVQGSYEQALYQFVQCLAANKKNQVCIDGMDQAYAGSERKGGALAKYIELLKKDPTNANAHFGYCTKLLNQKGMGPIGAKECEKAISLDAGLCDAYHKLGMYYKKVLNSPKALSNCTQFMRCQGAEGEASKISACKRVVGALK